MTGAPRRPRVLLVGDAVGIPQTLPLLADATVVAIVAASNRPQYHALLAALASAHGVPLLVQPQWQSEAYGDFLRAVAALKPSLVLCNSYSMILREDLLALAPMGGVNVHGGKVPEYRGPNPIQWAIISDEREAGVTVHRMTPDVDAGAVIAETTVPILFGDSWREVAARVEAATADVLRAALPAILDGSARARPQDATRARVWPRRTPDDGRIDWSASVLAIYNLIRALGSGIPSAFYEMDGERVSVEPPASIADVTAMKFHPGPGGFLLQSESVTLVPEEAGELVGFAVVRQQRRTGSCGIDAFDPERRRGRIWEQSAGAEAMALLERFARDELGLAPEPS